MSQSGRAILQPVGTLSGIGPRLSDELARFGFGSVLEIASLDPERADALAAVVSGISPDGMRRAVAEARFHLLGEDGAAVAAGLLDNAIARPMDLVAASTARIVAIGGDGWNTERALCLQLDAARSLMTFTVLLRVVDGAGKPVASPKLEVADTGLAQRQPVVVRRGDAEGWVLSPPLRRDRGHQLFVSASGKRRTLNVSAPPSSSVLRRTVVLATPPRRAPLRPVGNVLVGPASYLFDEIPLSRAKDAEVFRVGEITDGKAVLRSVERSFIPGGVVTRVVHLPADAIPRRTLEGEYVVFDAGRLRKATRGQRQAALASRGGVVAKGLRP